MNKFIVFEWLDWSWKDTHLNLAFDYITKTDKYAQVWKTREPTNNTEAWREIAKKLKEGWFKDWLEALRLYVQDRIEQTILRQDILKHSHILSSRFDYSSYAYQWAQGLDFDTIYKYHDYSKILIPDITFLFDVSPENIKKRLKKRWDKKEFFEEIDFLIKAWEKYIETYHKLKWERKIYLIDANGTIEKTFEEIKRVLDIELFTKNN